MQDRYARQTRLDGIGQGGQERIAKGRILIVGVGGLGCPAATYLAGAGVGRIALMDPDVVAIHNLHRQTLYAESDAGKPKVLAAKARLQALNAHVEVEAIQAAYGPASHDLVSSFDVVLDCTDDLDTKLRLAAACRMARVPLVHGAAVAWDGLVTVLNPPETPCYQCIWPKPEPGPTCADAGVMGPVVGLLGTLQAQQALESLLGRASLAGKLFLYDGKTATATTVALKRRPGCECSMPGACPMPWNTPTVPTVTVSDVLTHPNDYTVVDVREDYEVEEIAWPGAIHIPLGDLPGRIAEVPKGTKVACLCAVGGRSSRAAQMLRTEGIEAYNIQGGVRAWIMSGNGPA